jgi:hypothetical protein
MRRNWPGIVPAVSSFECYRRLDWGARDAFYEAALCDRISAAIFYLARRAFRFCRRELIRRASGRPAPEPSPAPSTETRSGALSLTDEALVCASPEQVSCRRNDDAAVLNLKTGACYGLDPVGAFLWSLIAQPRPVSFLVDQIQRHFEVGAVQCRRDVLSLLDKLSKEGLIEIRG